MSDNTTRKELVVETVDANDHVVDSRHATPADIAAAHPKCGTCAFSIAFRDDTPLRECGNSLSDRCGEYVLPTADYCRHHSEIKP